MTRPQWLSKRIPVGVFAIGLAVFPHVAGARPHDPRLIVSGLRGSAPQDAWDLAGTWTAVDMRGVRVSSAPIQVRQTGATWVLDNGQGSRSTARLEGNRIIAAEWNVTGTLSRQPAGLRIDWSNRSFWTKPGAPAPSPAATLPASPAPAAPVQTPSRTPDAAMRAGDSPDYVRYFGAFDSQGRRAAITWGMRRTDTYVTMESSTGAKASGRWVGNRITVDAWNQSGTVSSTTRGLRVDWSNGSSWLQEGDGVVTGSNPLRAPAADGPTGAVAPPAPVVAPPAAVDPNSLMGRWAWMSSGSGSFVQADVRVRPSNQGSDLSADLLEISLADPPGTPAKQRTVNFRVIGQELFFSNASPGRGRLEEGEFVRFADGTYWRRRVDLDRTPFGTLVGGANAAPAPPASAPQATPPAARPNVPAGRTATRAEVGPIGSGSVASVFEKIRPNAWVERSVPDGQVRFQFRETARDDWSVYLRDDSRNVSIQVDLYRRKVLYSDGSGPMRDLYDVLRFQ